MKSNGRVRYKPSKVGLKYGFRSGLEESIGRQLKALGIKVDYESLKIPYIKPETKHSYTPDFVLPNGIIIESKGRFVVEDRKKHLLIKKQHPDKDIRFVFSNANSKIRKGSKTTYAMWCDKHGFKYSNKTIPQEWIDE
jgi:hypothetical protein